MDQALLNKVKASLPFLFILLPVTFYLAPYMGAKRLHISRESVGEAWPFTFDKGTLSCLKPKLLIVTDTKAKVT
ncbi:MAG: hypothetical protein Q4C67_04185, partial [Deinococcus sp.]|nr:hypothetical protein [Deinococcus sp.]